MDRTLTRYRGTEIIEQIQRDVDWDEVRRARNLALTDSDWRAVKDRVLSNAWKDYRQALRDLPQDYETANDAADAFPEAPE